MKKLKVIIPARGGSKGLKNKHIQPVVDKPLIFWTLDQFLEEIGDLVDLYVSTDCSKITNLCLSNYDQVKILKRDSILALDDTSTEAVLKNIAQSWCKELKENEYVIYASSCEINRPKGTLRHAVESIKNNKKIDTFMYGEKSHKHLWENAINHQRLMREWMHSYSPRQIGKNNYLIEHTGLILITKLKYWLSGKRFGGNIFIKELDPSYRHIDIHNKVDIKIAAALLSD
tara:strand:- start:133 stop:822 length:690 start_codon:yes stop_codon:yes gene_type:complete